MRDRNPKARTVLLYSIALVLNGGLSLALAVSLRPMRAQAIARLAPSSTTSAASDELEPLERELDGSSSVAPERMVAIARPEPIVWVVRLDPPTPEEVAEWGTDVAGLPAAALVGVAEMVEGLMKHSIKFAPHDRVEVYGADGLLDPARTDELTRELRAPDRGTVVTSCRSGRPRNPNEHADRATTIARAQARFAGMMRQTMWLRERARELERR